MHVNVGTAQILEGSIVMGKVAIMIVNANLVIVIVRGGVGLVGERANKDFGSNENKGCKFGCKFYPYNA